MKKASVTLEFNKRLFPLFSEMGFVKFGSKKYIRIQGDIAQFLFLHVESRSRREFMMEYTAMLLCEPHDQITLSPGGRFKNGQWYSARDDESLSRSISTLNELFTEDLVPWFEACKSVADFITTHVDYTKNNPYLARTGHPEFTLACAHSRLSNFDEAIIHAKAAQKDYSRIYKERPICEWAVDGENRAIMLIESIKGGAVEALLEKWRLHSIEHLKIESIIKSG